MNVIVAEDEMKTDLNTARKHPMWTKFTLRNGVPDLKITSVYDNYWEEIQPLWAMYLNGVRDAANVLTTIFSKLEKDA